MIYTNTRHNNNLQKPFNCGVRKLTKTQRKLARRVKAEHKGNCPKHPLAIRDSILNRGHAKIMGLIMFHNIAAYKHPEV